MRGGKGSGASGMGRRGRLRASVRVSVEGYGDGLMCMLPVHACCRATHGGGLDTSVSVLSRKQAVSRAARRGGLDTSVSVWSHKQAGSRATRGGGLGESVPVLPRKNASSRTTHGGGLGGSSTARHAGRQACDRATYGRGLGQFAWPKSKGVQSPAHQ